VTGITRQKIAETAALIAPYIRHTPVIDIAIEGIAKPVTLKLEMLQHTGSFKARGAFANLVAQEMPAAGIAAASGGNHGAAAAFAAQRFGVKARIFVPSISAPAKVARIASYGAEVIQDGANYYSALENCLRYVAQSGALNIHAYDEPPTLLGQGTLGLEIESQVPDLDTLLAAVGGGGLIGGIAAAHENRIKVIGVEPATCNALHASLAAGERVYVTPSGIAADSLGASSVGSLMFSLARSYVDDAVLVSDTEIRAAQAWLWHGLRLVTEPGGATAFAALLSGAYKPEADERVGVVLCGANTDPETFARAITPHSSVG
jgi:threonine dehydratase